MSWSLRLLRAFLGVTFVFAGIQKLLDPNFLHPGSANYIGKQLRGFSQATPAAPLLSALERFPLVAGIGIALAEIAIGLGTLLGVGLLTAAIAGFVINTMLWLSATWHVHPYFLGSDSIYAVAWLALAAGIVEGERLRRGGRIAGLIERIDGLGRREFVRGALVAGTTLMLAGASRVLAGAPARAVGLARSSPNRRSSVLGPPNPATGSGASSPSATAGIQGKVLATLDRLPVGQAVAFDDPGSGPAVLVRLANDRVVAYSRICTHAGCLVGYDQSARILVCPCHGAEFDPARRASPIAGPASTPLPYIRVVVDQATRQVILPS